MACGVCDPDDYGPPHPAARHFLPTGELSTRPGFLAEAGADPGQFLVGAAESAVPCVCAGRFFGFRRAVRYVSGSPMVFMDIYHVDKKVYGWIFAFLSIAFIGLSQFNTLLLKKYSSEQIAGVALTGQVIVAVIFLAIPPGLPQTIFFIFLFLGCLGFVNPNAIALSLAPFAKNAGSASALMGALQMGMGALASIGISVFSNGTATPMIAIMAVTSLASALILLAGKK